MQMAFKLDGKHDIRGLQPTSMDTMPPPPVDCAMQDQSWAWHREPLMAGPVGHHTSRCPAMVYLSSNLCSPALSSRTLFCWRKISRCGVQTSEWLWVNWLLWFSLRRPVCLWPCSDWRFCCDCIILWDADCWVTLRLWRQRKKENIG